MGQQRKTGRVRPKVFMRSQSQRLRQTTGCLGRSIRRFRAMLLSLRVRLAVDVRATRVWTGRPLWAKITTVGFCSERKSACRDCRDLRDMQAPLAPADWIDGARSWTTVLRSAANSILNRIVSPFQRRMASASAGVSGRSRNDRIRPRMVANKVCASSLPG